MPGGQHEQRIDLHFLHLRVRGGEPAHCHGRGRRRANVEHGTAPSAAQQRRRAEFREQRARLAVLERRQSRARVAQDLGVDAAGPDQRHRAEERVPAATDDELDALVECRQPLHDTRGGREASLEVGQRRE